MKSKSVLLLPLILAYPFFNISAGVQTAFEELKDFTDFSVYGMSEAKTLPIFKAEFEDLAKMLSEKYLGEDETLKITFTDIDMAGDIQPWRNTNNADIRYIEAVYPPRLKFTYKLTDAEGAVIMEGEESISDLSFQMNTMAIIRGRYESFFYEIELLENWARNTLRDRDAKSAS